MELDSTGKVTVSALLSTLLVVPFSIDSLGRGVSCQPQVPVSCGAFARVQIMVSV